MLDLDMPEIGEGQILLAVGYAGICGTDLHATREPDFGLEKGTVPGHEFSGVVSASRSDRIPVGARVVAFPIVACEACRPSGDCARNLGMACARGSIVGLSRAHPGGFCEYVPLDAENAIVVDDALDMKLAALAEPFAVAAHALRSAGSVAGRHVAILGGGPIGLAATMIAADRGAAFVSLSEPTPARRGIAAAVGATLLLDPAADGSPGEMRRRQKAAHSAPSIVLDCAGVRGSLAAGIEMVDPRGTVVVVGICSAQDAIQPAKAINKAITVRFVLGYEREDFAAALDILGRRPELAGRIITDTIRLADAPETIFDPGERGRRGKIMVEFA